jgi:hypothetical protein
MEHQRIPRQGEIYRHFKEGLYQILTLATDSETGEPMVVYQALYGDFKAYVRSLDMFTCEVDHDKYPETNQNYRFELIRKPAGEAVTERVNPMEPKVEKLPEEILPDAVNPLLLKFLDAQSYSRKLEVLTSNIKHLDDRLINDMAVALDCAIDDGLLEVRIQSLIHCLKAKCRFEDRRLR